MNKTALLLSRNLCKFLIVSLALAFLSSCSSSNQFAANFGKRKYTRGHFTDPVAKIKTGQMPSGSDIVVVSVNQPYKAEIKNASQAKVIAPISKVVMLLFKQQKLTSRAIEKNLQYGLYKNNASLIEISPAAPIRHGDYGGEGSSVRPIRYLGYSLLCLGIAIVFGFLTLLETFGSNNYNSNAALGIICGGIAFVAFIAAVVYLIIWIIKGIDSLQG